MLSPFGVLSPNSSTKSVMCEIPRYLNSTKPSLRTNASDSRIIPADGFELELSLAVTFHDSKPVTVLFYLKI